MHHTNITFLEKNVFTGPEWLWTMNWRTFECGRHLGLITNNVSARISACRTIGVKGYPTSDFHTPTCYVIAPSRCYRIQLICQIWPLIFFVDGSRTTLWIIWRRTTELRFIWRLIKSRSEWFGLDFFNCVSIFVQNKFSRRIELFLIFDLHIIFRSLIYSKMST